MDIRAYLAEQGLTAEEITAVVGNEKTAKAMTAALAKYEEGLTLSTKAQTDLDAAQAAKLDAEDFWEKRIVPATNGVAQKVASANSETARYKAYLQSLKDQGYEVPADLLTAPVAPVVSAASAGGFTRDDFQNEMKSFGPTMVTLVSLSNEYQDLYGTPYLTGDQDFTEAQAAHKPFREYMRGKYKLDDKRKEKSAAAEQSRIDAIVKERVDAERAKLQTQFGSNAETRSPVASRFDKIERPPEQKDSWKTDAGRKAARQARLAKYENVRLQ